MVSHSEPATDCMSARLAIVIEIIAPYRIPVFNFLAEQLGENFLVLFMSMDGGREWSVPVSRLRFPFKVMKAIQLPGQSYNPFPRYWNPKVGRYLDDFAPTLTVISGYHHPTSLAVWWYAKRSRSKLYLLCESTSFDKRSKRLLPEVVKRAFIRTCDGHIVPGRASAAYLRSYGVDENLILFAPNSLDIESFPACAATAAEFFDRERECFRQTLGLPAFNLLFAGRLAPGKGAGVAIEVAKRLQRDGVEVGLIILGDGPLREQLEAMVQADGVRNAVFLGFKQPGEMTVYYRMADLLIHPAESEPWGLVVNEAMTCGVPVLCSPNVGAAADMVHDGETGYTCHTPEQYVRRIRELLEHPGRLRHMQDRCRQVAGEYSPQACAAGFLAALQKIRTP